METNNKHTAGQWSIVKDLSENDFCPYWDIISDINGRVRIASLNNFKYLSEDMQDEVEANAKLIAASPKLLEACKEAESTIDLLLNNPRKYVSTASCKMSLSKILAAINQATS